MTTLHVTFRVGTADYALPAAQVLHLESFDRATRVPGAPAYVAGLVQVRGRVVPVVDVRARFGLPPVERTLDHRVIIVQIGSRVACSSTARERSSSSIPRASRNRPRCSTRAPAS